MRLYDVDDSDMSLPYTWNESEIRTKEQLQITSGAVRLLAESLNPVVTDGIVALDTKLQIEMSYPLETREWVVEQPYAVPKSLADVMAGIGPATLCSVMDLEDELGCAIIPERPEHSWTAEKLTLNTAAATLLGQVLNPPAEGDCTANLICRTKKEIYIELPLFPLAVMSPCTENFLQNEHHMNTYEDVEDISKEEITGLALENLYGSSSLLEDIIDTVTPPTTPSSGPTRDKFEIDMPLTPRALVQSFPVEVMVPSFQKDTYEYDLSFTAEPSSSNINLDSVFGLPYSEQGYDMIEELSLFDTSLRIPEPVVSGMVSRPDLRGFPSRLIDLSGTRPDPNPNWTVEVVPARYLDVYVKWTPFVALPKMHSFVEELVGAGSVDDYVEPFDSMDDGPFCDLVERVRVQEEPTSPLRPVSRTPACQHVSDGSQECANEHTRKSPQTEDLGEASRESKSIAGQVLSSVFDEDHQELPKTSASSVQSETLQVNRVQTPETSTRQAQATRGEHHERYISSASHKWCAPNIASEPVLLSSHPSPDFTKTHQDECGTGHVPDIVDQHVLEDDFHDSEPSSDDSLNRLLLKRRHESSHQRAKKNFREPCFDVHTNVGDFMRLRGKERDSVDIRAFVPPEPISEAAEVVPVAPQIRHTIAPGQDDLLTDGRKCTWIISTSLLQRSVISRQLRKSNAHVTFLECDLVPMLEADLIVSPISAMILIRVEHLESLTTNSTALLPAQERILNLFFKYSQLCLIISFKDTMTIDQHSCVAIFTGWVQSQGLVVVVRAGSEQEQAQYLSFFGRKWSQINELAEVLEDSESCHELFLRDCPLLNAMSARLILHWLTLIDFLQLDMAKRRNLFSQLGWEDNRQSDLVHNYFTANWHLKAQTGVVVNEDFDFIDQAAGV